MERVASRFVTGPIVAVGFLLSAAYPAAPAASAATHSQRAKTASAAQGAGGATAGRLWAALLKQCGDTYIYTGSAFDRSGMLSDVQVGHTKLIEYKGVKFASVPIRVTDAERANGLEARARITMRAHLYRTDGDQWQDGPDMRPRNMDDIIGRALGSVTADMFDMGTNGAIALEILKFKGRWYTRRSSVDRSGPIIGSGGDVYDLEKLMALPRPTYECATHSIVKTKQEERADNADANSSGDDAEQ